jgi:hypothetical protein
MANDEMTIKYHPYSSTMNKPPERLAARIRSLAAARSQREQQQQFTE